MKAKIIISVESVIIVFLVVVLLTKVISFKDTPIIIREPEAPGESALAYTPPSPPKIPLNIVKKVAMLRKEFMPTVDKITENIYLARGFALGSSMMIITDEGLVIIDTTESQSAARKIFSEFRKVTDKPVKYIIYTHAHPDHIFGTPVFLESDTRIISTADAVREMKRDFGWRNEFHDRSRDNQAGRLASEYSRKLPLKSPQPFKSNYG